MIDARAAARLLGGEARGRSVSCPGPGHSKEDRSLSVSFDPAAPEGFLVHSFAGDDDLDCRDHVRETLRLPARDEHKRNNGRTNGKAGGGLGRVVATYDYTDELGELMFQVVRLDPKSFRQRRKARAGDDPAKVRDGWIWSVKDARRVIYRLPEVIEALAADRTIVVAEGEKDVDALWGIDVPATCNVAGAKKWRAEDSAFLKGADVVILPDADEPGREHAKIVAASLNRVARRVRVVDLPGDGKDPFDWLAAGGTAAKLWELVETTARDVTDGVDAEPPDDGPLAIIDGIDSDPIKPRQWLQGTSFCKGFMSGVAGAGGTGKTALRLLQLIGQAVGRSLTGESIHRRARVLAISLEDGRDEYRRRQRAVALHHKVAPADTRGFFFWITLTRRSGKLAVIDETGAVVPGALANTIEHAVKKHGIELVHFDPFVKAHGFAENDNKMIDEVMSILADLGERLDIAVDMAHHVPKGASDPGNADRFRGGGSMKDALRLGKTVTAMSTDEAKIYNIPEHERRRYIRYDDAKMNLTPYDDTLWFKLVSVDIGNGDETYPGGDSVQTVEPWEPPDTFEGMTTHIANRILDDIDAGLPDGERYTDAPKAQDRHGSVAVLRHLPSKTEPQARKVLRTWVKNGVLDAREYDSPTQRKKRRGLYVNAARRPS